MKLRWINGWTDESGNYHPYVFYVMYNGVRYDISTEKMENFLKKYNLTTNDFRSYKQVEYTKMLLKELFDIDTM